MNLRNRYMVALLIVIVIGIYYPSLFAPFNTVDDIKMVTGLLNKDHFSLWEIFFPGGHGYYYRPLVRVSFCLDKFLWGQEASFMHLENILLHAANTVLVFFLTWVICRKKEIQSNLVPFLASLLFAVHPINTEAVNWISGRTDLLACMFLLFSMLFLFLSLENNRLPYRVGAFASYLFACFCKDSAVFFLPGALFVIFFYDETRWSGLKDCIALLRKRATFYGQMLLVPALYFTIRHFAFAKGDGGVHAVSKAITGEHADYFYIFRAGFKATGFYASKLFNPFPLNFAIITVPDYFLYVGVLVAIYCCYLLYRRDIFSSLLFTSVSVGSSALLVVYGRMAWTPIAERYLYIPSATFAVAVVLLIYGVLKNSQRQKQVLVASLVLFAVFGYATVSRNIVWQDNLTLFRDTVKKSPNFPPAKNELAIALLAHGRKAEAFQMFKANKITNNLKNKEYAVDNIAMVMAAEGDLEGARSFLIQSINEESKNYLSQARRLIEIDMSLVKVTKDPEKVQELRAELSELFKKMHLRTRDPFYLYRIGQNYMIMKNMQEARRFFAQAYEAAPDNAYYKEPAKKLAETLQ